MSHRLSRNRYFEFLACTEFWRFYASWASNDRQFFSNYLGLDSFCCMREGILTGLYPLALLRPPWLWQENPNNGTSQAAIRIQLWKGSGFFQLNRVDLLGREVMPSGEIWSHSTTFFLLATVAWTFLLWYFCRSRWRIRLKYHFYDFLGVLCLFLP